MPNYEYISSLRDTYASLLGADPMILGLQQRPEAAPPFDLALYPPTDERPVGKLTTIGLSADPMAHPEIDDLRVELAATVPPELISDEGAPAHWIATELVGWGAYLFEEETYAWHGHTLAAKPIEPLADGVDFVGWLAIAPVFIPEEGLTVEVDGHDVEMLDLFPIYESELEYVIDEGWEALLDELERARVPPLVAPGREDVSP